MFKGATIQDVGVREVADGDIVSKQDVEIITFIFDDGKRRIGDKV